MRCELRRLATISALLFAVSRSFAASPEPEPEPVPAVVPSPIHAALCGRGKGPLATALDKFDFISVPPLWREMEIEKLQPWFEVPICPEASEAETRLSMSRRRVLEDLRRRLERAKATEEMGAPLAQFQGWRPSAREWPSSFQCGACMALWSSADRIAEIAARWPPGTSTKVGDRLDKAAKREPLVAEFCAAKPPPDAQASIETRFLYYSWTADGAKLFEVAALFKRPEIVAECPGR